MSHDYDDLTDYDLLAIACEGDPNALSKFCSNSLLGLKRYILRLCHGDPDLTSDMLQDTIVKVVEYVKKRVANGKGAPDNPRSFIFTIARNTCISHYRKKSPRYSSDFEELEVEDDPAEQLAIQEEFHKFVGWLGGNQKEIIELMHMQGMDIDEAANVLDISMDAAYKCYERALAALRDMATEHGTAGKPAGALRK